MKKLSYFFGKPVFVLLIVTIVYMLIFGIYGYIYQPLGQRMFRINLVFIIILDSLLFWGVINIFLGFVASVQRLLHKNRNGSTSAKLLFGRGLVIVVLTFLLSYTCTILGTFSWYHQSPPSLPIIGITGQDKDFQIDKLQIVKTRTIIDLLDPTQDGGCIVTLKNTDPYFAAYNIEFRVGNIQNAGFVSGYIIPNSTQEFTYYGSLALFKCPQLKISKAKQGVYDPNAL